MFPIVVFVCYSILVWFLVKRDEKRTAIAFVVAPLAPGVAAGIMAMSPFPFLVVSFFTYLLSLLAVPFYFLYKRLGWLHFFAIVLTSALLGVAASVPLNSLSFDGGITVLDPKNLATNVGYATLVGLVFWLVALAPLGAGRSAGALASKVAR